MQRYRDRDLTSPVTATVVYTWPNDPGFRRPDSVTTRRLGTWSEMYDEVTPRFHYLRNSGHIINNPMRSKTIHTSETANYWSNVLGAQKNNQGVHIVQTGFVDRGAMFASSMCPTDYLPVPDVDVGRLKSLAITEAWSKVDASVADGLVMIAEAKKTLTSLADIMKQLIQHKRRLRELDTQHLEGAISSKELQDGYMQVRYAIRPLVYDAESIVEAWNTSRGHRPRFTARSTRTELRHASDTFSDSGRFSSVKAPGYRNSSRLITVRAGVLYTVDTDAMSKLQTWGLTNIPSTLWELSWLSFVFDWFVTIGETIAAWEPKAFCTPLASWVTVQIEDVQQMAVTHLEPKPDMYPDQKKRFREAIGSGSMTRYTKTFEREPSPDRPFLPQLEIKLDFLKILDLTIILKKLGR